MPTPSAPRERKPWKRWTTGLADCLPLRRRGWHSYIEEAFVPPRPTPLLESVVLPAFVWVRSLPPWGMVDRSPLPCDANCLNAQKNGSARAARVGLRRTPLRSLLSFYPHETLKSQDLRASSGTVELSLFSSLLATLPCWRSGPSSGSLASRRVV